VGAGHSQRQGVEHRQNPDLDPQQIDVSAFDYRSAGP
jgi:hypothetical protein